MDLCQDKVSNEQLIEAVSNFRWLYDPADAAYRDVKKKNNSWDQIRANLGLNPDASKFLLNFFAIFNRCFLQLNFNHRRLLFAICYRPLFMSCCMKLNRT